MNKTEVKIDKENLIYGGLFYREDGCYKWWTDGNKHYIYEKVK